MMAEIRVQYQELDTDEFPSEHEYDDIRKKFPGEHVRPHGCLLVAMSDNEVCGCVALGQVTTGIAEVRTLDVRPAVRGVGVGRTLVEAGLDEAPTDVSPPARRHDPNAMTTA